MAGFVNKAILVGRTGQEPQILEATNSSTKIATFSLATTERGFTKRDGTEVPERTEWHNITAFGNLAKVVEQYVHKGMSLYVEGHLNTSRFTDRDGVDRKETKIIADDIQFLNSRKSGSSGTGDEQQPRQAQSQPAQQRVGGYALPRSNDDLNPHTDDLPF